MKKLIYLIFISTLFLTNSCGIYKYSDARDNPVNADERVKKNIEEGRGFRLGKLGGKGGDFMFASSNPMWRATMQKLSFAPLSVVDYGGGIIITDWFSEGESKEEIKIAVRFLTNEIRSDAIDIKVFYKDCKVDMSCKIFEKDGVLKNELRKEILKQATIYQKQSKDKDFKKYNASEIKR